MAASPPFQLALAASKGQARALRVVAMQRIDPVLFVFSAGEAQV